MKVILVFVSTLDGKITKWGDPHVQQWSSKEDQAYFNKNWKESPLIVIGSSTFDFDPIKPTPGNRLIVLTHTPQEYEKYEAPGQVEFSLETPTELVARLRAEGYEKLLAVGGPHVATSFLKEELVDELWLTIEPKIFGKGGNFVIEEELDIELEQISVEQLNVKGTLLCKYRVLKANSTQSGV